MTVKSSKPLRVVGDYDIVRKIADGGMGTVYQGRHKHSGLMVAIKSPPPARADHPVLLQRFELEFRAARLLDHPNIVKAIEWCGTNTSPFLVMEFVDGESLGEILERDVRLREADALKIITDVCRGLHHAHTHGLIHRDVKPHNIIVTTDGVAKLTDFGLVKDIDSEQNLTHSGRGFGTPHFMAPEQFRNAKDADIRCDIYSLGATLYVMLTGQLPFGNCDPLDCWLKKCRNEFPDPKALVPEISARVSQAIHRAMSANPDKRQTSCEELLEALTGRSIEIPPEIAPSDSSELWYLVYLDERNTPRTAKGNARDIRTALQNGLLGDAKNIRAATSKLGPFRPLKELLAFRDLVIRRDSVRERVPVENALPNEQSEPDRAIHPADIQESDWWVWFVVVMMGVATGLLGYLLLRPDLW